MGASRWYAEPRTGRSAEMVPRGSKGAGLVQGNRSGEGAAKCSEPPLKFSPNILHLRSTSEFQLERVLTLPVMQLQSHAEAIRAGLHRSHHAAPIRGRSDGRQSRINRIFQRGCGVQNRTRRSQFSLRQIQYVPGQHKFVQPQKINAKMRRALCHRPPRARPWSPSIKRAAALSPANLSFPAPRGLPMPRPRPRVLTKPNKSLPRVTRKRTGSAGGASPGRHLSPPRRQSAAPKIAQTSITRFSCKERVAANAIFCAAMPSSHVIGAGRPWRRFCTKSCSCTM